MESLELKIAKFLRIGVVFAGILMFAGWMTQFKFLGNSFFNFETYDHIPLVDLLKFHFKREDWGIFVSYLGLGILVCLPVIRVTLTAYLFIRQKEYALSLIAFTVLLGLIFSMSLGIEF
jgi:uncharacterized membrane protein